MGSTAHHIRHEIPPLQPTEEPRGDGLPVNDAETRLRHLLHAAGFGDGVRGEQIRLNRVLGTTTPDVIYRSEDHDPDEGVCIYLDGLSGQLHGNPETAERDREIRTWLRNGDYDVIEVAANELHDHGAMTRHFRKLARYLGMRETQRRLRDDPSWFHERADSDGGPSQPVAPGKPRSRRPLRDLRPADPAPRSSRRIREPRHLCRGVRVRVG